MDEGSKKISNSTGLTMTEHTQITNEILSEYLIHFPSLLDRLQPRQGFRQVHQIANAR